MSMPHVCKCGICGAEMAPFESPEGIQCRRCGRVSNDDLCPRCAPPPVDNLHVAEGCEPFSSAPDTGEKP